MSQEWAEPAQGPVSSPTTAARALQPQPGVRWGDGERSRAAQMLLGPQGGPEALGPAAWDDPLEVGMGTHSSILAWRIPWTEEPDGLQSTGSQKNRTRLGN